VPVIVAVEPLVPPLVPLADAAPRAKGCEQLAAVRWSEKRSGACELHRAFVRTAEEKVHAGGAITHSERSRPFGALRTI